MNNVISILAIFSIFFLFSTESSAQCDLSARTYYAYDSCDYNKDSTVGIVADYYLDPINTKLYVEWFVNGVLQKGIIRQQGTGGLSHTLIYFPNVNKAEHNVCIKLTDTTNNKCDTSFCIQTKRHCDTSSTTGLENIDKNSTFIFPNPTLNSFKIKSTINQDYDVVQIIDPLGKIVQSYRNISNNVEYDISTFGTGTYFVLTQSKFGIRKHILIVK